MFCILIPATLAPVIGTLLWAQIRAKRLGLSATDYDEQNGGTAAVAVKDRRSIGSKLLSWAIDIDALGLILFGAGWACVLLPLTLTNKNTLTWSSYKIIILFVVGGCTLIGFLAYERFLAKKPLFPFRFFKSYTVVACAVIPLLDFISFCACLFIVRRFPGRCADWPPSQQTSNSRTSTLSLASPRAGVSGTRCGALSLLESTHSATRGRLTAVTAHWGRADLPSASLLLTLPGILWIHPSA